MKFKRSPEEVKSILKVIADPEFLDAEMLVATFKTTPEFIKSVLPPPLEPTGQAVGSLFLATWGRSNSVGAFRGAALYVQAKYKEYVGDYCLTMPMNTDTAIIFGRETMGEPKKQAQTDIVHDGKRIIGTVKRHGTKVMRVTMDPTGPCDPKEIAQFVNFHHKFTFATDGSGLDHDPKLVHVTFNNKMKEAYACDVKLELAKSCNDVYGDIPVLEMLKGWYTPKLDMYATSKYIGTVSKDEYLPWAFFKVDPYDCFNR